MFLYPLEKNFFMADSIYIYTYNCWQIKLSLLMFFKIVNFFGFITKFPIISELHNQFLQTRAERVREVLFPETLPDDQTIPNTQYNHKIPTSVQRLAQPSQMLKNAVVNLIHYQVFA